MPAASFELTALARLPLLLLERAAELGLDRRSLLEATGLGEAELQDPDARIEIPKMWNLWRIVIERAQEPGLGVRIGASAQVRQFGLVGYAVYYSRTLRDAFSRLDRYSHIISKALKFKLETRADHGLLVVEHNARFDALRHPLDARLAAALAAAREITQTQIVPREVCFPYDQPEDTTEHQRFFRCPFQFSQPRAAILFGNEDLDRSVIASDETLSGYLDHLASEVLETLESRGSFVNQVRRAIWSELSGGTPTLGRIAGPLGVSERTLQRRLREEDTSFATVLDAFRHEMALRLLRDRGLAIYEVAFLLGYAEPSTFYRAFRRWRSMSPDEFRRATEETADHEMTP